LYRGSDPNELSFEDLYLPFGGKLRSDNRWVILSKQIPSDYRLIKVSLRRISKLTFSANPGYEKFSFPYSLCRRQADARGYFFVIRGALQYACFFQLLYDLCYVDNGRQGEKRLCNKDK